MQFPCYMYSKENPEGVLFVSEHDWFSSGGDVFVDSPAKIAVVEPEVEPVAEDEPEVANMDVVEDEQEDAIDDGIEPLFIKRRGRPAKVKE